MTTNYRDKIRSIAEDRDVQFLLHFTQAANLAEIVKHGLLSRRELEGPEYLAFASDLSRLDENDMAVSVSISRLNEAMFASKRRKSGHRDWVVLVLSADILWTLDCVFCWCNAAKKEIKGHRGWRGGPWAFDKMFAGNDETRGSLPWCYPTDPEAEVQVMEPIAPEYILGAVVDRLEMADAVQTILEGLQGEHRPVAIEDF